MPDLSTTEGTDIVVKRWLIDVGAPVKRGQSLLEVETDKATMEVESVATGTLTGVLVQPEDKVGVGQYIATIEVGS
jgi:pyruvate/2-oxoglutarate dehydrogenase complex dihydrolipoamide acyltransferase (E2) component